MYVPLEDREDEEAQEYERTSPTPPRSASFLFFLRQIYAVRSLRTVTLVSEFPFRKIQIVLRLYKTLAEVLHGFDVDACSVGFDGHTVRGEH